MIKKIFAAAVMLIVFSCQALAYKVVCLTRTPTIKYANLKTNTVIFSKDGMQFTGPHNYQVIVPANRIEALDFYSSWYGG